MIKLCTRTIYFIIITFHSVISVYVVSKSLSCIYFIQFSELEKELKSERQEYEDLTAKYEILEEEHVVTKAQLVMEKETIHA